MAVNNATGTNNEGVPHFDNLFEGGTTDGYLNAQSFGNDANSDAFRTTVIISNVVENFADQIYRAAAGGVATVSLGNNRLADITTSAGALQVQTYFLALKTSAQTTALLVANQEKNQSTIVDALT